METKDAEKSTKAQPSHVLPLHFVMADSQPRLAGPGAQTSPGTRAERPRFAPLSLTAPLAADRASYYGRGSPEGARFLCTPGYATSRDVPFVSVLPWKNAGLTARMMNISTIPAANSTIARMNTRPSPAISDPLP